MYIIIYFIRQLIIIIDGLFCMSEDVFFLILSVNSILIENLCKGGYSMRCVTLLLFCALFMSGCGRMVKVPEQERMVRKVFEVQLSKNDIYDRALEWCAKRLSKVNDDIVVKNKEGGKIIARGTGKYSEYFDFLVDREFSYNMTIEVKDKRYRVTFDNFTVYYDERQIKSSQAQYKFELDQMSKKMNALMDDLRDYISRGAVQKEKQKQDEEW